MDPQKDIFKLSKGKKILKFQIYGFCSSFDMNFRVVSSDSHYVPNFVVVKLSFGTTFGTTFECCYVQHNDQRTLKFGRNNMAISLLRLRNGKGCTPIVVGCHI
ncbi:hypothetical protein OSB04_019906 [Centaurea solstitialis]|uniref:Uncharacterized protein n=1 Tax=Centaurea solstitialis TaxID=347529 RepID=A0AA38SRQ4_9ASTR|nr:hypothetical protein OSB04_019906 [Centaurea solstitialis]